MQPTADVDAQSRWLAALLDQHGGALALYAAQWTSAADDCVQEALVELASRQPKPDRPVAWLYRVVKRRALNHARSERRRAHREQIAWHERLQQSHSADVRRELLDSVDALPSELREIVVLKTWGGLTFEDISQAIGSSSSTVQRHYVKALQRLRELWSSSCPKMTKSK